MVWLFEEIEEQIRIDNLLSYTSIAAVAGVGKNSLYTWKQGSTPVLANFDAVCQVLGYKVSIRPIDDGEI